MLQKNPSQHGPKHTLQNALLHRAHINLTRSHLDVELEPPGLLPSQPGLRPADVGLHLAPPPKPTPFTYLPIDVTITQSATLPTTELGLPDPHNPASSTHRAHHASARSKFSVAHATEINDQRILLLPFTVDPLAGIGSFAHSFLYGDDTQVPPASPPPSWTAATFPSNQDAYTTFTNTTTYCHALLAFARTECGQ